MRILLVEDEESIVRVLSMLLKFENYQIECARDGAEALAFLANNPRPDVILLDLMMPVMDGWEFLERQQADSRIASIPTIVLSAFVDKGGTTKARYFIKKPIDIDELLQSLKDVASP